MLRTPSGMLRTLNVAAVQTAAHDRSALSRAWPAMVRRIREAAAAGAQLVVLPEGTLPAYVLGYEPFEEGETAEQIAQCARVAREANVAIVIGAARREGGRTFNSAIAIDRDGSLAGSADKHFLWHFDRQWFAPGERIEPIRTSIGNLGILICADGRIPLIARTLVDRGAEILVMPTAWVTSGRDPANLENVQADLLARIRAKENGVPFIAANKCGVELGCVAYCGKSQIVAADGRIRAIASQRAEQFIEARVEIGGPCAPRARIGDPMQRHDAAAHRAPVRIALAARDFRDEAVMEERLRILEAQLLLMPHSTYPLAGHPDAPVTYVDDEMVLDPAGLAAFRLGGVDLAVWNTALDAEWHTAFAKARAIELRMFVVTIDASGRAYAADPDGTIVCGTFDGYELASFTYDPSKSRQTFVAPGTDVWSGLERARDHAHR